MNIPYNTWTQTEYTCLVYTQSTHGRMDGWTGGWTNLDSTHKHGIHRKYAQHTYTDIYPTYIHSIHTMDSWRDRQTDRQTDRHTHTHTHTQTDRQGIYSTYIHDSIYTKHSRHT